MTTEQPPTDPTASGSETQQREERYSAGGPVTFSVHLVSGDCVVHTTESTDASVQVTAKGPRAAQLVADTAVDFDATTRVLTVSSPLRGSGFGRARRWLDLSVNHDIDVVVELPAGSSVDAHSASGDIAARGRLGAVESATASGDLIVDAAETVRARSASGDVWVGSVGSGGDLKSTSGDVTLDAAAGPVQLDSVSGDLHVGFVSAGSVVAHTVSGDVVVAVKEGLFVAVNAKSLSGSLRSDIALDGSGDLSGTDGEMVDISARSVSGDVLIRRGAASGAGRPPRIAAWIQRVVGSSPQ